ncbi:polysaccharide deacetylase family protein [Aneurinibacillus sp. REN35]|uniref:polysaccharide deacetylase family protein n=1 Tax=Aneurinibacillus sp. REN35 TaxID=3237286 RepID=UPI0035272800
MIKGTITASIVFFLLFLVYASVQAHAYQDTVQKLTRLSQKNEELQKEKELLTIEYQKAQEELEHIKKSKPQSQADPKKKIAYLTFDDGPSTNTAAVLSILQRYKVKATFFVIGNETEAGKQMYKRIVAEGHAIGLHSYTHDYRKIYASPAAFHNDFTRIRNLVHSTTGLTPTITRFPGGSNNHVSRKYGGRTIMQTLIREMKQKGYQYFDWNVDSTDASRILQSREMIVRSVLQGSKNKQKAIILMHDSQVKTTTVEALPAIIEGLVKQGFSFDIITAQSFTYQFASAS